MPTRKPKVIVTRRLPDPVETRMRVLFDTQLNLSENTVKNHLVSVFEKLSVRSRSQAAALYVRQTRTPGPA